MRINISVTVKTVGRIAIFDDGKLEESEGYNYFFVIFYVLKSKQISSSSDLLSNKPLFGG